uniref:hypothetical protein n=2 Tax=unclassified Paraflavitalea TaxID=2798305 RepID=UPI003D330D31
LDEAIEAKELVNALTKSLKALVGVCGLAPPVLYQLLTLTLNLSPAITFKMMAGPNLLPLPLVLAAYVLGLE